MDQAITELDGEPDHQGPVGMDGDSLDSWASDFRTKVSIELTKQADRLAQKQSYFRSGFEKRKYPVFHSTAPPQPAKQTLAPANGRDSLSAEV